MSHAARFAPSVNVPESVAEYNRENWINSPPVVFYYAVYDPWMGWELFFNYASALAWVEENEGEMITGYFCHFNGGILSLPFPDWEEQTVNNSFYL